jgi:hypothetical protein
LVGKRGRVYGAGVYAMLWLVGLALVGRRLFWGHAYRWWFYLPGAAIFLSAHIWHTAIVYARGLPLAPA